METLNLNFKRIFVTGGAGVIGLELIPLLVNHGFTVLVGDLKPQPPGFENLVKYRQGDLNYLTQSELSEFDPEVIIHLAASFERSTESIGFWDENFANNINLSHHIMTLAQGCNNLRRVIFASSYLIYDPSLYQFDKPHDSAVNLSEDAPIRPRNLTGTAKLAHEMELRFLAGFDETRFSTLSIRIFRGYGCGSRDVISRWIRKLLNDENISVYRPEGMFDYICAEDSAEGIFRLTCNENVNGVVNLGTGKSRRVSEIIQILRKHFPNAIVEQANSDIPFEASAACTAKLEANINWKPHRTLEDTIPKLIAFERVALATAAGEDSTKPFSILLTSASRKIPLINALKAATRRFAQNTCVIAGDIDTNALAKYEADQFWLMPETTDDNFQKILNECNSKNISAILPSRDGELEFWAKHARTFHEAGVDVIVSPLSSIRLCRDKFSFSEFGKARSLPIIPAFLSPDLLQDKALVVKERFGSGSKGVRLNIDKASAREVAATLESPIFQPYIEGPEISIDGYVNRAGVVVGVVLRRRNIVLSGESQVTTTFREPNLERQATSVIEALNLRGPIVLQAIVTESGLQIIECNPRFGGASTASIAVGLDSLYWCLVDRASQTQTLLFQRSPNEICQVRLSTDRIYNAANL
jgi:carbamoyl-phosphate synthase large subunit